MAERSKRREKKAAAAGATATIASAAPSDAVFREQLFASFQDKGVVQSLKTQLRERLASDLLRHAATSGQDGGGGGGHKQRRPSKHRADTADERRVPLGQRLADALLREHLESCSYDYTLSVFMAECGQRHDQFLAMDDVRKLLHVSLPASGNLASTKRGSASAQQPKGCLLDIVQAALARHTAQSSSQATQTEELPRKQLGERMADLEVSFSKRQSLLESGAEAQMLSFQNKCREQCQEELLRYKAQYAATELAKMQLDERRRYEEKLQAVRREYDEQHRGRLQTLQVREQESSLALQRRQQDLEGELYRQRQNLLDQIEHLRKKEAEVQQGASSNEQKVQSQMLRLERDREEVDKDQRRHQQESENFQQHVQAEVQRCQLRMEQELQEKSIKLEVLQGSLKERDDELSRRSKTFESLSSELSTSRERLLETQEKLHHAIENHHNTVWQRDRLQEIVSEVKDYSSLKEQVALLQRELESANRRAADARDALNQQQKGHQSLVKELSAKLSLASPEVALLKDELEHAKDENRRHTLVAKETQQMLMQRLQHESERSDDAARRLQELQIREKSLQLEIEDLRRLLAQAESALARPGLHVDAQREARLTKKSFARTVYENSNSETSADDARRGRNHQKAHRSTSASKAPSVPAPSPPVADAWDASDSAAGISDHWSLRLDTTSHHQYFRELEREAEELEKSYKDFQLRLEGRQPVASASSFLPTFSELAPGAMASLHLRDVHSSSDVTDGRRHVRDTVSTRHASLQPQHSPVRAPQHYHSTRGAETTIPPMSTFAAPPAQAAHESVAATRAWTAASQRPGIYSSAVSRTTGGGLPPAGTALHQGQPVHTLAASPTHGSQPQPQTITEGTGQPASRHVMPEFPGALGAGMHPQCQSSSSSRLVSSTAAAKPSSTLPAAVSNVTLSGNMPGATAQRFGLVGDQVQHQVGLGSASVGQDVRQSSEWRPEVEPTNHALQPSQRGLKNSQSSSMASFASTAPVQHIPGGVQNVQPAEESLCMTSLDDVSIASASNPQSHGAGNGSPLAPGLAAVGTTAGAAGGVDAGADAAAVSPSPSLPTSFDRAWAGGPPMHVSGTVMLSGAVTSAAVAASASAEAVRATRGNATALTDQGGTTSQERNVTAESGVPPGLAANVPDKAAVPSLDGARGAESGRGDASSKSTALLQPVMTVPAKASYQVASEPAQAAAAASTTRASVAEVPSAIGESETALIGAAGSVSAAAAAPASTTSSSRAPLDGATHAAALQAERRREQRLRKEREEEERLLAEQEALEQLLKAEEAERHASHRSLPEASLDTDASLSEISFSDKSSASTSSVGAGRKGGGETGDAIDSSMLAYMKLVQEKRAAETATTLTAPPTSQDTKPSAGALAETLSKQPSASPTAERKEQSAKKVEDEDWSLPEDSQADNIGGWGESDNGDSDW